MSTMIETHLLPCPECGARLKIGFPTTCIASHCELRFQRYGNTESECSFLVETKASKAVLPLPAYLDSGRRSLKVERNTDYAVNILYVLSFVASGDGDTEAARTLGLLGLPNSTTMQSRSFGNIESSIGPTIINFTDRIIYENLKKKLNFRSMANGILGTAV